MSAGWSFLGRAIFDALLQCPNDPIVQGHAIVDRSMLQFPVKFFRQLDGKRLRHLSELSNLSLLCRVISLFRSALGFTGDVLFETDLFRRKEGREIKPLTVQEILNEEIQAKS
jgi:hypothetical protein